MWCVEEWDGECGVMRSGMVSVVWCGSGMVGVACCEVDSGGKCVLRGG